MNRPTLPPERDLQSAPRMLDEIVGGAATLEPRAARRNWAFGAVAAVAMLIVVGVVTSQLVRDDQVAVPVSPVSSSLNVTRPPSATIEAKANEVVDLGDGRWVSLSAPVVLESWPELYVLEAQLCAPAELVAGWTITRADGTPGVARPGEPQSQPAAECATQLRAFQLDTLKAGAQLQVSARLGEKTVRWELVGSQDLMPPESTPAETARPTGPVEVTAQAPGMLTTRYFDVQVGQLQVDPDGTSWGVLVKVCYVVAQPEANPDGTTRTSLDPWQWFLQDGEGGGSGSWVPVAQLPQTTKWGPLYSEKALRVGQCNEGWITADHGNPDLLIPRLGYRPTDFGDQLDWRFS